METRLAEQRGSEVPHSLPPALLPEMSYSEALKSHFTLDQVTYTIGNCPSDVFERFIEKCGQASLEHRRWKPLQQADLLHLLEKDCSDIARWYAINLLLEHKVKVPLEK
jgi:hypothetical protein